MDAVSVLTLGDDLSLGEGSIFLAVVGRLYCDVPFIIDNKIYGLINLEDGMVYICGM